MAREFSKKARELIRTRDNNGCIFCAMGYRMEKALQYDIAVKSVMHYIPRSKNGLGIPENGAVGCQYHHDMLDNGKDGCRPEMLGLFREYLKKKHPGWDESGLVYRKWDMEAAGSGVENEM